MPHQIRPGATLFSFHKPYISVTCAISCPMHFTSPTYNLPATCHNSLPLQYFVSPLTPFPASFHISLLLSIFTCHLYFADLTDFPHTYAYFSRLTFFKITLDRPVTSQKSLPHLDFGTRYQIFLPLSIYSYNMLKEYEVWLRYIYCPMH